MDNAAQKREFESCDDSLGSSADQRLVSLDHYEIWSLSHEVSSVALREQLTRLDGKALAQHVVTSNIADEMVILSTCNRFELFLFGLKHPEALALLIAERCGVQGIPWIKYRGEESIEHSFKVSSGLTSMVLGETQILGQIKNCYTTYIQAGTVGKFLHSLFQFSFKVAKRVRDKTSISREGVSVGSVAVRLAQEVLGDLSSKSVLLVGSGEQAEVTLMHLKGAGVRHVTVVNRTLSRAAQLAERFHALAAQLSELPRLISDAELIIGSVLVDHPIVDAQLLRKLSRRPRVFLDLGVPRNFSASVADIGDSYLYTIDDLGAIAQKGNDVRKEASKDAQTVVDYGIIKFRDWFKKVLLQSTIIGLREKIATYISEAIPEQALSHAIAEKISHEVIAIVRAASHEEVSADDSAYSDALMPVFIERFFRS